MEQNNEQIQIPTLKAGSSFTISITSDVYHRLLILIESILEGKTEEDMAEAKKQIDEKLIMCPR